MAASNFPLFLRKADLDLQWSRYHGLVCLFVLSALRSLFSTNFSIYSRVSLNSLTMSWLHSHLLKFVPSPISSRLVEEPIQWLLIERPHPNPPGQAWTQVEAAAHLANIWPALQIPIPLLASFSSLGINADPRGEAQKKHGREPEAWDVNLSSKSWPVACQGKSDDYLPRNKANGFSLWVLASLGISWSFWFLWFQVFLTVIRSAKWVALG